MGALAEPEAPMTAAEWAAVLVRELLVRPLRVASSTSFVGSRVAVESGILFYFPNFALLNVLISRYYAVRYLILCGDFDMNRVQ